MRLYVKNIMDDTLSDLRSVRPRMSDESISKIIANEMKRFGPVSDDDLRSYLNSNKLPIDGQGPSVEGRTGRNNAA